MSQDTTVLVCCHKKDYWYDGPGFLPIQVGKALSNIDLGIQGDNTGDNISSKIQIIVSLLLTIGIGKW